MKKHQYSSKDILQRYVNGNCTEEERRWVEKWYKESYDPTFEIDQDLADEHFAAIWNALESEMGSKHKWSFQKIATIAASLAIVFGIGIFYTMKITSSNEKNNKLYVNQLPIKPGRDQALLTLADGRTLHLDSIAVGGFVTEHGITIKKMEDGTLSYEIDRDRVYTTNVIYNTISTPRGGQYKIVLPDNSVVWLNAASSLRFPVVFSGDTRAVELHGEGYFEVAHNKEKPFIVTSKNQQTIVKGTKFNISAYTDDEKMVTTLLEGSVLIKRMNDQNIHEEEVLLSPNEQAVIQHSSIQKSTVETIEAIAWKNGKFMFNNTPLHTIMKQLSRWYDVEVVFQDRVEEITFTGYISRFEDIHDVLRKISLTESVRFEMKERRIMVRR